VSTGFWHCIVFALTTISEDRLSLLNPRENLSLDVENSRKESPSTKVFTDNLAKVKARVKFTRGAIVQVMSLIVDRWINDKWAKPQIGLQCEVIIRANWI